MREQARALRAYGLEVGVVYPFDEEVPAGSVRRTDEEGIITWRANSLGGPLNPRQPFRRRWARFGSYRSALKLLREAAGQFQPDILHVHVAYPAGILAYFFTRRRKLPYVITEHMSYLRDYTAKWQHRILLKAAFQKARLVIPVSLALAGQIESFGWNLKLRVLPNVVDTSRFTPDSGRGAGAGAGQTGAGAGETGAGVGQTGAGAGQTGAGAGETGAGAGQTGAGAGQTGAGAGETGAGAGETGAGAGQTGAGAGQTGAGAGETGAGAGETGAGAGETGAGVGETGAGVGETGAGAGETGADSRRDGGVPGVGLRPDEDGLGHGGADRGRPEREGQQGLAPLRLLFVGGMDETEVKGLQFLLPALAGLARERRFRLELIGDGSLRQHYEARARELGIEGSCRFRGVLPPEEMPERYREADFLVLSSLKETFGCVLIEAMASGIPVLATACGGPESLVTAETGLLVKPGSSEALLDGMREMARRLPQYKPAVLRAYADTHFGPRALAEELKGVYRDALAG